MRRTIFNLTLDDMNELIGYAVPVLLIIDYLMSREPRSLLLFFLKSGKRIFKPRFSRTKFARAMPANQLSAVQT
jgi:hypothetical protein